MTIPKELTTTTLLSRCLTMILFMALPFIGFYLGIKYQQKLQVNNRNAIGYTNPPKSTQVPSAVYQPVYVEHVIPIPDAQTVVAKTKAWKTYRNDHFSFKYPDNWEVKDLLKNNDLERQRNTTVLIGIRPVTLTTDVAAQIRVSTESLEEVKDDLAYFIREYKDTFYEFNGDFQNDEILNLIYSTFRFLKE